MKTAIALLSATLGVTAQSCLPSQVLINYADSPDQMRVSWAAPCSAAATVAWGTDSSTNQATTGPAPIQYKSFVFSANPVRKPPALTHTLHPQTLPTPP
jgi:hypothetical protein